MSNHKEARKKHLSVGASMQLQIFEFKRGKTACGRKKDLAVYNTICLPREPPSSLQQDFSGTQRHYLACKLIFTVYHDLRNSYKLSKKLPNFLKECLKALLSSCNK